MRPAAVAVVLLAAIVVGVLLLGSPGSDDYRVKARFQNAAQLVKGAAAT